MKRLAGKYLKFLEKVIQNNLMCLYRAGVGNFFSWRARFTEKISLRATLKAKNFFEGGSNIFRTLL